MLFYLLLSALYYITNCGHIYPHDTIVSPNNKNNPSQFTFIFTLDTAISDTDLLRIVFPFRVNNVQPGLWDEYIDCDTSSPTKLATITATTIPNDDYAFFVRFYTNMSAITRSSLSSNVPYYLTFVATPDSSAQSGINFPIGFYTVSNDQGHWITYDSNPVFATIELNNAYIASMGLTITIPASETNKTIFGRSYNVTLDIVPTTTISNRAKVEFETTNSAFEIVTCNTAQTTISGFTKLSPVNFTSITANKVRGIVTGTLTAGNKYRFYCRVKNPSSAATSGMIVRNYKGYVDTIVESGSKPNGLTATTSPSASAATTWDETNGKILLGWGYDASDPAAPSVFSIYKDNSASEKWYQSVMIVFRPSEQVDPGVVPYQVLITTLNDDYFTVLTNSFHHNLPDYSVNDTVSCNAATKGYITCINVGGLSSTTSYFVSFKFNLANVAVVANANNFGKVQLKTQEPSSVTVIALSTTTLTNKAIITNPALYHTSGTSANIAYSTTVAGSTTTPYITNGEPVTLHFKFNYFTNSIIPLQTSPDIDKGIEFYTTPVLPSAASATCAINGLTNGLDLNIGFCSVTQTPGSHTLLRFRIQNILRPGSGYPPYSLFTASPNVGQIDFGQIIFPASKFSSITLVSDTVFDFYARWVQGFTTATSTVTLALNSVPFFFNSLVYSYTNLANLQVSASFFFAGATPTDYTSDGTYFPTLIRVSGSLTAAEQSVTQRLLLFFNDMEPLNSETPCFGPENIVCKYTPATIANTQKDTLPMYGSSSMMEIILSDYSQKFNIYIPVQTAPSKLTYGFFIAVASTINATTTAQGQYQTMYSKRINARTSAVSVSGASYPIDPAGSPRLIIPASTTMGSAITSTTITGVGGAYIASTNTGSLSGGAYGYCADYDFTVATGFGFQVYQSVAGALDQVCVKIQYTPPTSTQRTCYICPVHSTMSAGSITVSKFTMPTNAGVDLYDLVLLFSKNDGDLQKAIFDRQAGVLTALSATTHSITFSPTDIKKDAKNAEANFEFTTTVDLPKKIRVNFVPYTPSTTLQITPSVGATCYVDTITISSCQVSGSDTNIQLLITATEDSWPAGTHKIRFIVDSKKPALVSDLTLNYRFTITVDGISSMSALHHSSNTKTFVMRNQQSEYFNLSNMTYYFGNKAARTRLSFMFYIPGDIKVFYGQKIVMDLGGLATANVGENPVCYIKESDNVTVSTKFYSCMTTDLHQLTLIPKDSVIGSYVVYIEYVKVPSSSVPAGISIKVVSFDGVNIVASNLATQDLPYPVSPSTRLIPAQNINYTRLYSDPGSVSEIVIGIRPTYLPLSVSTSIYVYFPSYYAANLGYSNIDCQTNGGLLVKCELIWQRLIQISAFPITVNLGSYAEIRIYGVITPVVPSTPGKIFIGIDNDNDYFQLTEQIELTDVASVAFPPSSMSISSFTTSSNKIRDENDYTMIFTTDAIGIKKNRVIAIDFPDQYGPILRGTTPPKFKITKVGDIVTTTVQSTGIGSRFKITLPIDLLPTTSYRIVISPIENPENPICSMDWPTITVSNAAQNNALYKSAANTWDVPRLDFIEDTSLQKLYWQDKDGNPLTSLTVSIGIFSPIIRIVPESSSFVNDIVFSLSRTDMSLLPSPPKAYSESSYMELRIGASNNTYPSLALIDFIKTESTSNPAYMELPKLELILTYDKKVIPTPGIRIAQGSTSLPYYFDLESLDLIPHTELKMDIQINDPINSPLSIVGGSSVTFTSTVLSGSFVFSLTPSASITSPPSFNITITGQDSKNYVLQNQTITVEVIPPRPTPPVINQLNVTSFFAPTRQSFSLNMDSMCTIYWHVAYQGQLTTTDCEKIRSKYSEGKAFDEFSATQEQYGVFYIYQENVNDVQILGNLLSQTAYSYVLCPSNQSNSLGTATNGTFITDDNGARIQQLEFAFSEPITRDQVQALCCLFKNVFNLPNGK